MRPLPTDPRAHVEARYALADRVDRPEVWVARRPVAEVAEEYAAVVARARAGEGLPLAGVLLAVKGNTDVAGLPTTAGCPAFAYAPERDAVVVARLRGAGAVVVGVTNLDQFATGLVGTRSPYGAVRHASDPRRISGGSSSGSAVAVALGLVDAALGTDTAGSGRVPAALHGLVGVKPTKGSVPATGVVPACRSQDVVTAMAADLGLARLVAETMTGPDDGDPLSRPWPVGPDSSDGRGGPARVGVPATADLGDLAPGWAAAFEAAAADLAASGAEVVPLVVAPFLEAAQMLYGTTLVAERYTAVGAFVDARPDDVDPVVGGIIAAARDLPAWRVFADLERLDGYRARAARTFGTDGGAEGLDALLLPTTTRHPTIAEVAAEPVAVNADLGRFTNFANLLDCAALAVPAGTVDGLPFGVQLVGPAFSDRRLAQLARSVPGWAGEER